MGDSGGGPGGPLAHWRGGGSHDHFPHLETGKEKGQSWWVACNFLLNVYSIAAKLCSFKSLMYLKVCHMSDSLLLFNEHGATVYLA